MTKENLFDGFSPVSAKEWKQKIQFDLKGADYNDTLVWESPEGINVKPFYHSDDITKGKTAAIKPTADWKIGHTIYAGNATLANAKALEFLDRGAESILFIIPSDKIDAQLLLKNIDFELAPVYFELQFLSSKYANSIMKAAGDSSANIHLNIDILGNLARTGNWYKSQEQDHESLGDILALNNPNPLMVDASLYQNAGANIVQELAYALGHANEYLDHYQSLKMINFKVAIGPNYFFEIAKLRALRLLWQSLAKEYNSSTDCHITAVPSKRNKTLYNYNANMLRTTTESMSAVLGGANTVFNLPYDAIYHKTNEFGERIALNQLLLLKNESHFDKVSNVVDGTYFIEKLTLDLAEKALELFKILEKGGGFLAQLRSHTIQKKIKESAQKQVQKFENGEEILVGTNKFSNGMDKMKDTMELYPFVKTNSRKTVIEPIIEKRLAESLEKKRLDDE